METCPGLRRLALAALGAALGAALLSGCATALPEVPAGVEHITYDPQPPPFCFGCAVTRFTLSADGGLWLQTEYSGRPRDLSPARRRYLKITPETYTALRERLAPYRTARDFDAVQQSCERYLSDGDGLIVVWSDAAGEQRRYFDFNCEDDRVATMALRAAPEGLALGGWEAIRSTARR